MFLLGMYCRYCVQFHGKASWQLQDKADVHASSITYHLRNFARLVKRLRSAGVFNSSLVHFCKRIFCSKPANRALKIIISKQLDMYLIQTS